MYDTPTVLSDAHLRGQWSGSETQSGQIHDLYTYLFESLRRSGVSNSVGVRSSEGLTPVSVVPRFYLTEGEVKEWVS